jgi:hypothetical protein
VGAEGIGARKDGEYMLIMENYRNVYDDLGHSVSWEKPHEHPRDKNSANYNFSFPYGCVTVLHSPALCVSRLTARRLVVAAVANGPDATTIFFELPLEGFLFFRAFFFSWNSSKLRDGRASIFSSKLKSLKERCG